MSPCSITYVRKENTLPTQQELFKDPSSAFFDSFRLMRSMTAPMATSVCMARTMVDATITFDTLIAISATMSTSMLIVVLSAMVMAITLPMLVFGVHVRVNKQRVAVSKVVTDQVRRPKSIVGVRIPSNRNTHMAPMRVLRKMLLAINAHFALSHPGEVSDILTGPDGQLSRLRPSKVRRQPHQRVKVQENRQLSSNLVWTFEWVPMAATVAMSSCIMTRAMVVAAITMVMPFVIAAAMPARMPCPCTIATVAAAVSSLVS
mmetsp:Transcript_103292/g.321901  ORF Transcript_103292/g.321901 Transcript_103292/m.321901 type:complete len:261 (+) Transcript_103292:280-1062(+)